MSVDRNIASIEALKTKQYHELAFEVWQMHHVEVVLAPLVIGAFGTVSKNCAGIPDITECAYMSALLGTANTLRRVFHL